MMATHTPNWSSSSPSQETKGGARDQRPLSNHDMVVLSVAGTDCQSDICAFFYGDSGLLHRYYL